MRPRFQILWAAGAAALAAAMAAAPASARGDYDGVYFVKTQGTAVAMLQDRADCQHQVDDLGNTSMSYSNPQYGALNAMGSALDEDALHEGGLHKRLRRAVFDDCMKAKGWIPLQPEGPDAKAIEHASLRHPDALDSWLKSHAPPPAPPTPNPPPPAAKPPAPTSSAPAAKP